VTVCSGECTKFRHAHALSVVVQMHCREVVLSALPQPCSVGDDGRRHLEVRLTHHVIRVPVECPPGVVVALFAQGPSEWIRPFLLLSASALGSTGSRSGNPRHHVEALSRDGALADSFAWCPDAGPRLFERFVGRFAVSASFDGATVLVVDGEAFGGSGGTSEKVLTMLLDLLAAALAEGQTAVGNSMIRSRTPVATASSLECASSLVRIDWT
jgi:hypothetical protein